MALGKITFWTDYFSTVGQRKPSPLLASGKTYFFGDISVSVKFWLFYTSVTDSPGKGVTLGGQGGVFLGGSYTDHRERSKKK